MLKQLACVVGLSLVVAGCGTTESHKIITPQEVTAAGTRYSGPRYSVSVGKFDNQSNYMRGLFSDGTDRLGGQSKTILVTHLQKSGRFNVLDRTNLEEAAQEAELQGVTQNLKGAGYVLTGQVTEFGRKEVGDKQLFGILGAGKKQVAYTKVSINVVDVLTSDVVYSAQGAGEYMLSNREIIGFGGAASYDSTLNGKVLDLAIREAVDRLVEGIESGQWAPASK